MFLVYNMSYKSLIGSKPLHIRFNFDKINGFVRVYNGTKYLVLFGAEKYGSIYNRIRYLIGVNSSITYVFSHNYVRVRVDSYNFLLLKKHWLFML